MRTRITFSSGAHRQQRPLQCVAPLADAPRGSVDHEAVIHPANVIGLDWVMGRRSWRDQPVAVRELHWGWGDLTK
jgi:hypothetical protein